MENEMIEIPNDVIEGLLEVRESGAINMFDRRGAIELLESFGWDDAAEWLANNKGRYMDALNEMGKLVE